jgi:V-type H+-transporting ATPase subunit a
VDNFLEHGDSYKLDEVEADLKKIYQNFTRFKENNSALIEDRNGALEERFVVQVAINTMDRVSRSSDRNNADQFEFQASRSLLDDEEGFQRRTMETMFSNIAGVLPQAEQDRFARALFRATRGNTFTHFQQIFEPMQDPKTLKPVHKSVFVVYYQDQRIGMSTSAMADKIKKICNSFGVNIYSWPASKEEALETHKQLQARVDDQDKLLRGQENYMRAETQDLVEVKRRGGNSKVAEWEYFCCKEKSIYATLNLFEGNMNLRADCWYPAADEDHIRAMLIRQSSDPGTNSTAMLVSDRHMTKKKSTNVYPYE